jgi:pimeloyl-ACP methyl ester carboxylesterase
VEAAADEAGDVVVVGNSLGGTAALRAGQRADLPIAGVVPIAPAGLDMARWFELVERDPVLRTVLAVPAPLPEAVVRQAVGRAYRALAFARPGAVDQRIVDAFTSHHRDRATVRRYLETARVLLSELHDCYELAQVRCPVLIVWGGRDRMVSPSGAQRVIAALPATACVEIDDCGHCPQIEAPERLVELLLDFPRVRSAAVT